MEPVADRRTAVVLLYPGCTIAEVIELATRLIDADLEVRYAALERTPFPDRSQLLLSPDISIDELDLDATIEVVIVPGGDPGSIIEDERALRFLRLAAAQEAVMAGICAGVLLLGAAGLLVGRSITHNYRRPWAPPEVEEFVAGHWAGADVEADPSVGVVVDGPMITALPNATIDFATTVCQQLGVYPVEQADQIARHLRGEYVEELYRSS